MSCNKEKNTTSLTLLSNFKFQIIVDEGSLPSDKTIHQCFLQDSLNHSMVHTVYTACQINYFCYNMWWSWNEIPPIAIDRRKGKTQWLNANIFLFYVFIGNMFQALQNTTNANRFQLVNIWFIRERTLLWTYKTRGPYISRYIYLKIQKNHIKYSCGFNLSGYEDQSRWSHKAEWLQSGCELYYGAKNLRYIRFRVILSLLVWIVSSAVQLALEWQTCK